MRSNRSTLRRSASALAMIASTLVFATCDLDKITATKQPGGSPTGPTFAISGGSDVILAGTTPLGITPQFEHLVQRWSSSAPTIASVDSVTGMVTGLGIGSAVITARLLGMELDTGYTQVHPMQVRYKGIRIAAVDSIAGLGHTRAITVNGTNNLNVVQPTPLTGATFVIRDSGATTQTIASLSGQTVKGLKGGVAYLKATYDQTLIDSIKIRVRQVAKSITFGDTVFTSNALNFNRRIQLTVKDVADSIIPNPTLRWRSSDTSIVSIDSMTGIFRVKTRDTARVFARMDTVTRSQKVRLIQTVGSIARSAGDAQTDTVVRTLATALEVTALDSGGVAVPGETVTFRVGNGVGAVITDSVKTTDANGKATLGSWTLGTNAGTQTVIAASGVVSTTFTATVHPAGPRKVGFVVHPTAAAIGTAVAPAIKVAIQDSLGNTVTTATDNVTLSFNFSPNGTAALGGTLTTAAVNGVATFSDVTVSAGGTGFVLLASSGSLASGVSNSFDVFGAAAKLAFTTQPIGSSAGGIMQPVRVAVQDANGALVATANDNVTLTLGNPAGATLGGTLSVVAVNGVATFNNLTVSAAGSGYTLQADATNRTQAISSAFTVAPVGAASKLAFSVQPSNAASGAAISPAIKVQVLDVNGALVTSSAQQITLSVEGGTPIAGNVSIAAVNGEATFTNVSVARAGTGYKLVATATGTSITSTVSAAFNITAAAAAKLGFVQNPTHTVASQTMAPAVTVAVQDANGNTVSGAPATPVTLALAGAACTPTALSGGGAANTSSGVATFAALSISSTFNNCTLTASTTGLTSGTSTAFNVVSSNGPVKLAFTTEPAASTTAGVAMNAGTVNIQDSNGNNVNATTQAGITLSVLSGPSTQLSGTTFYTTTSSATFTNITFNKAGTYRLLVSATGYRPDTSAAFTVSAGAASALSFVGQPSNIIAGVPFATAVQVAVVDAQGNTVTSATNSIQISANLSQTPFTGLRLNNGLFTTVATAVNGVATFSGLSVRTAATAARMFASSAGLNGQSGIFDVTAAPVSQLSFRTQPPVTVSTGATITPAVEVQAQDSVGNVHADFANPVTVTLTGGTSGATLGGTKTVTPVSGVASFSTLSVSLAGTGYRLAAVANGVSTANSSSFNVASGAGSNSWQTLTSMPNARSGSASEAIGGIMYVAGGYNGGDTPTLQSYNPGTSAWATLTSMPGGRYQGDNAVVIAGELYVPGGWTTSPGLPNSNLFIYNPTSGNWRSGTSMPILSACGTSGVINGKLYVTTGCDGNSGYRSFLHVYDPATPGWTALASSPNPHANGVGGVIGGKLYVAGGYDASGGTRHGILEVYDPATNGWTARASMPTARIGASAAVFNGKLYVFGGIGTSSTALTTVEVYDPVANSWATLAAMPAAREFMTAAVINGIIYLAGGTNGTTVQNTLTAYTP